MSRIVIIIVVIVMVGYIGSNMTFADTSNFDEKVDKFEEQYCISDITEPNIDKQYQR